jgi:hypothetical protein
MPYSEQLAERVREALRERRIAFEEKPMMGGLCFMVQGKMCLGVEKLRLMARIDPDEYQAALGREGCVPMDFTGRPMRGFVFVNPEGIDSRQQLQNWVDLALEFNPRAVASRHRGTAIKNPTAAKRAVASARRPSNRKKKR